MIAFGLIAFFYILHKNLKKDYIEESFIIPKVVCSMMVAYIGAGVVDSLFKMGVNGSFIISGITFYGGLIFGVASMWLQLLFYTNKTKYSKKEWFDILTVPFVTFHMCGRIGCFFAGCCYGKVTTSLCGIKFPDNIEAGIYHYGEKCYPTQLFEAFFLLIILIVVLQAKKKFFTYITLYAVIRFFIEFFRGDERGGIFPFLSPAQTISAAILLIVMICKLMIICQINENE